MNAAHVNPFLASTAVVFQRMLGIPLTRGAPIVRAPGTFQHEVTGLIGVTGKGIGTMVLSMSQEMAATITEKLMNERPTTINPKLIDAVGEVVNMIASGANHHLKPLHLHLGLPTVVTGKSSCVSFPSGMAPICVPFTSAVGPLTVEVGLLV